MQRALHARNSPPLSGMSPRRGLGYTVGGIGELAGLEVCGCELVPPVVADAVARLTAEFSREWAAGRIHGAYRDAIARGLYRKFEVAVIADDHGGIDALFKDVEQEVGGHVDVGAFFFTSGCGDHEHRGRVVVAGGVFDHEQAAGARENGSPLAVRGGQRRARYPVYVVAQFDVAGCLRAL